MVLYDDLIRRPDHYEVEAANLLQDLASGHKKLTELGSEEMEVLNRATIDLNRVSSNKPLDSLKSSSVKKAPKPSSDDSETQVKEASLEDDLIPQDSLVPEWFR